MKREEITVVAQLLTAIKDALAELEKAQRKNDEERVEMAKREILGFQKKLDELL